MCEKQKEGEASSLMHIKPFLFEYQTLLKGVEAVEIAPGPIIEVFN